MPKIFKNISFLTPKPRQPNRPLFVFLPGMDGTGQLLHPQIDSLEKVFDLRCLAIPPDDLSDWDKLSHQVVNLIEAELERKSQQCVYLCGESFGGCLALAVARRSPQLFERIILINPASSFVRRPLLSWGAPFVGWMPQWVYQGSTLGLLPFLADSERVDNRNLLALLNAMKSVSPQTASWRLSLLKEFILEEYCWRFLTQPVLILASSVDRLLPSVEEAERLVNILPQAQMVRLPSSGHTCLLEKDINLYEIIKAENFLQIGLSQRGFGAVA